MGSALNSRSSCPGLSLVGEHHSGGYIKHGGRIPERQGASGLISHCASVRGICQFTRSSLSKGAFSFFMFLYSVLKLFAVSNMSTWLNILDAEGSSNKVTRKGCYTFHDVDSTWEEARDACRGMMAYLVTMETTDEWNKVKGLLKEKAKETGSYTHYYIGLRKKNGMWKWAESGGPGATVATNDSRWQKHEPSGDPTEVCAEINSFYRNQYGHFNNVRCNSKYQAGMKTEPRGYICEDL